MNIYLVAIPLVSLLLLKAVLALFRHLRSDLRSVQGPSAARWTLGWYTWKVWQGSFEHVNRDLHKKYGSVVRYAPNRYSFSDLEAVKVIYSLGTSFPKSPWYIPWGNPGDGNLFNERSLAKHAHDRKQYQSTYSMSSLVNYEAFVDESGNRYASLISMGLGFLDKGEDVGNVIDTLGNLLGYSTIVGIVFPTLHNIIVPVMNFFAGSKGSGAAYVTAFTKARISEVQSKPKAVILDDSDTSTQSFLMKFLAKNTSKPDAFTTGHALKGCLMNMVAGSDTTGISLSAVLYYLLKNPSCMDKLREEVDTFTANGQISTYVTYKKSQEMPYLQAVIKEALRLHPATGLPLERVVPKGGATISGRFFPEGAIVGINTWIAYRDRGVFGQDADSFSPERWLQDDEERVALMNRFWMPFGLGSRTCVGRHISMLEMCKLVPALVRDFEFTQSDNLLQNEWKT
ncbi:pisatin demethylase cytochrome P450 [Fusarium napiforme]|uniref:Pisatin demethylase cytochrome P450 n=1 Tax=Fusarium napiforme TaxID=42672 RepID=A0A8H5IUU7_9HYPO|nr:pisatin demethylase cytochrome P450 [Fusarium napiforme]